MVIRIDARRAFSLVEVVLALGLVSFVLVALLGLFVVGMGTERDSGEHIRASNLASRLITERRNNPLDPAATFALPALNDPSLAPPGKLLLFSADDTAGATASEATIAVLATSTIPPQTDMAYLTLQFYWPAATANLSPRPAPNYRVATAVRIDP